MIRLSFVGYRREVKKIRGTSSRRLGTRWKWVRYAGQEAHAISCMGILLSQM
jgi:hypothetical protein